MQTWMVTGVHSGGPSTLLAASIRLLRHLGGPGAGIHAPLVVLKVQHGSAGGS